MPMQTRICPACAQPVPADSRYCEHCGAAVTASVPGSVPNPAPAVQPAHATAATADPEDAYARATRLVSPGITLGVDGVMRWVFELNMWKNPTLVITIWKLLLLAALVPALLVGLLRWVDGDGLAAALATFLQVGGLVAAVVTVLMLLAYPLVALLNGGRYCVIFEMDQRGIRHIHMQRQFRRSQALAALTVLAGAVAGNAQTAGAGLLAGARRSLYTAFRDVRRIEPHPGRQVIHLATRLTRNQVYAAPEDFDFVLHHIAAQCKPAVRRQFQPSPS
jgi:hypothetical protein